MTKPADLRPEAEADLLEAASWYEAQRAGLGFELLAVADEVFVRIGEKPLLYPEIEPSVRRALIQRFPFAAYFQVVGSRATVIAVLHHSRAPQAWQSRRR